MLILNRKRRTGGEEAPSFRLNFMLKYPTEQTQPFRVYYGDPHVPDTPMIEEEQRLYFEVCLLLSFINLWGFYY